MIHITYSSNPMCLSVKGHAGSAEFGQDTVCAAVSMLVLTLANGAYSLQRRGLARGISAHVAPGDAMIALSGGAEAQAVFDAIVEGLWHLCRHKSEFVQMKQEK